MPNQTQVKQMAISATHS